MNLRSYARPAFVGSAITILLCSASCTSTTIVEPFYRPANAQVDDLYVSPRADFSRYTKLMANPLEIYYPDSVAAPNPDDLARMRRMFREAFLAEVGDDYPVVTEPGPDVMLVIAQIVDLKILGPRGQYEPSGRLRDVVTKGQLTLLMEFRDSMSDRVLLRAGESEQGNSTALSDREGSWDEVAAAANRWAGLFKQFLDRNLGGNNRG